MHGQERRVLMPILARGSHAHPRGGGCFAEVAAAVGTGRWTDHPACLPPVLAEVVRGVNDRTSAAARTALAPLIPWAIGRPARPADLAADVAVVTALTVGLEVPGDRDLDPLLRQLDRPPRPGHVLERVRWRRAARRLVRARLRAMTATPAGPERDDRLRALLSTTIGAVRAADGVPPLPEPVTAPLEGPLLLPVATLLTSVDEVFDLRVEPLLNEWPAWFRTAWTRRLSELAPGLEVDGEEWADPHIREHVPC
jgi:hypothetical protein